jgi:glycosyltransferase involved in cell wall biosynthesis
MKTNPTVSVIIPAYNRAQWIGASIQSVLDQTYTDYEIIVVDDGSTDDTAEVIRAFTDRVRYVYQENGGAAAARNRGMRESRGEYLAFLDSDDLFMPEKLQKQVEYLQHNPHIGMVYSAYSNIDGNNNELGIVSAQHTGHIYRQFLFHCNIQTSTIMIRRQVAKAVGEFDVYLRLPEDIDYWIRIARHYEIGAIDEPLSRFRTHPGNIERDPEKILNYFLYIAEKNLDDDTGPIFHRRVYASIYYRSGQRFMSQDPPMFSRALDCLRRGLGFWPFSPAALLLAARILFRAVVPDTLQARLRPLWRR